MNQLEQFKTVYGASWSSLDTGGISMESKTTAIKAIKQEIRLRKLSTKKNIPSARSAALK